MFFVTSFTEHFQACRHDVPGKTRQYACGLMQTGSQKNMDRMAQMALESKLRNLQQFITHSKWVYPDVIDHVAHYVNQCLCDRRNAFLIDGKRFSKQGKRSVVVSGQ